MVSEGTGEVLESVERFPVNADIREYTTLPDTMDSKIKMFNARNNAISLVTLGEAEFHLTGVFAEPGVRARSQDSRPCQNTYLFDDEGHVLFTQSSGISRTVNELVDMIGGDFEHGTDHGYITVRVTSTALNGGRTYKRLELISL